MTIFDTQVAKKQELQPHLNLFDDDKDIDNLTDVEIENELARVRVLASHHLTPGGAYAENTNHCFMELTRLSNNVIKKIAREAGKIKSLPSRFRRRSGYSSRITTNRNPVETLSKQWRRI